jgi:hypothetical protein
LTAAGELPAAQSLLTLLLTLLPTPPLTTVADCC